MSFVILLSSFDPSKVQKEFVKQENIPEGCIQPACWREKEFLHDTPSQHPPSQNPLSWHLLHRIPPHSTSFHGTPLHGTRSWHPFMAPLHGTPTFHGTPGRYNPHPLWAEWITDRCKKISCPKLRLWAVISLHDFLKGQIESPKVNV